MASTYRVLSTLALIAVLAIVATSSARQLRRTETRGDVDVYLHGAALVLEGEDIYARPEPRGQQYYLYLPLLALLFVPLTWIPFPAVVVSWTALNAALAGWIVVAFFRAMTGRRFSSVPERVRWIVGGAAILLTLRAILYHLALGQANLAVMAVAVFGLALCATAWPVAGGVALGLAIVLKVIVLPLSIPFLVQGRARVVAGIAVGAFAGLLLPALFLGFDRNLSYIWYWFTDVLPAAGDLRSTRYWPLNMNYSFAAQLYRYFSDVTAFEHDGRLYSVTLFRLPDPVVIMAARLVPVLTGAAIAWYAWLYRRRQDLVGLWGALALAFCLAPVFSTLSHKHYFVTLLPAHLYVVYVWYALALRDRWFRGLVIASFAVAIASTTLFDVVGVVVSNLGGLAWGAILLAAAIFRVAAVSPPRLFEFNEPWCAPPGSACQPPGQGTGGGTIRPPGSANTRAGVSGTSPGGSPPGSPPR